MGVGSARKSGGGPAGPSTLSPLIHGRVRLMILSHLARARKAVPFSVLRRELALTDGTLSVHLGRLEEGGLVKLTRTFKGKRPQTLAGLTPQGKSGFRDYIAQLRDIVPGLAD